MAFKDYLKKSANEIDLELYAFLAKWSKEVEQVSLSLLNAVRVLQDSCSGGKRIRGAMVKLGYELGFGVSRASLDKHEILKVAVAYEIFQTAILGHDDIIDKSPMRRDKRSMPEAMGGGHMGISKAICLGDIGFFLAFRILAESDFSEKKKNKAIAIFSKMMLDTGLGELLDVELSDNLNKSDKMNNSSVGIDQRSGRGDKGRVLGRQIFDEIISIYKYKTAFYTFSAPMMIGAVLGGSDDKQLEALKLFGQNLGIAFQIQDDVNDIFSDAKTMKKEIGGDIKEGKLTILYELALEGANTKQFEILNKFYGNPGVSNEQVQMLKQVFVDTNAHSRAIDMAREYAILAREQIGLISHNFDKRNIFADLVDFIVK